MSTCGSEWGKGTEKLSKIRNLKKKKRTTTKPRTKPKLPVVTSSSFLLKKTYILTTFHPA